MNPLEAAVEAVTSRQKEVIDAFRGQIHFSNSMDVQLGHLWDSVEFKAGDVLRSGKDRYTPIELFNRSPIGRTMLDTNMYEAGRLDVPEAFSIQRICFTFSHLSSDEDIYAFAESVTWELMLGQKWYLRTPLILLAPVRYCENCLAPYAGTLERCPKCAIVGAPNLGSEPRKCFFLEIPRLNWLVLAHQLTFRVSLHIGKPHVFVKDFKVWCHFQGLHARGVS